MQAAGSTRTASAPTAATSSKVQPARILIVTGEASGELYGAELVRTLRRKRPDLTFCGIGSSRMAEAGVELLFDNGDWGAMGVFEAVKGLPSYLRVKRLLDYELTLRPPDLVILIDFGAFNTKVAQKAKSLGLKVLYFLPPRSWSRQPRDWSQLCRLCDAVATQFPWSADLLSRSGCNVEYVGHPLVDLLEDAIPSSEAEAVKVREFGPAPRVGLLPGSRHAELRHMLSPLLVAGFHIRRFFPQAELMVSRARPVLQRHFDKRAETLEALQVELYEDVTTLLKRADLVLACSGTVTLEAALLATPMIIAYRANPVAWIQYLAVRPAMIGLPNIIAGKPLVPELIQPSGTELGRAAVKLLQSPALLRAQRKALYRACAGVLKPGAFERTAEKALQLLQPAGSELSGDA